MQKIGSFFSKTRHESPLQGSLLKTTISNTCYSCNAFRSKDSCCVFKKPLFMVCSSITDPALSLLFSSTHIFLVHYNLCREDGIKCSDFYNAAKSPNPFAIRIYLRGDSTWYNSYFNSMFINNLQIDAKQETLGTT